MTADESGFTLLEVLVAFIILSIILAPLLQGGSAGVRNVKIASETELAVSLARSHLNEFDAQPAATGEDLQGDESGYHWRLQAVPTGVMQVPVIGRSKPASTVLYRVAVTVSWASGHRRSNIRLETQRLTPVPPTLQ